MTLSRSVSQGVQCPHHIWSLSQGLRRYYQNDVYKRTRASLTTVFPLLPSLLLSHLFILLSVFSYQKEKIKQKQFRRSRKIPELENLVQPFTIDKYQM